MSSPRSIIEPTMCMYMPKAPTSTPGVLDILLLAVLMVLPKKVIPLADLRSLLGAIKKPA